MNLKDHFKRSIVEHESVRQAVDGKCCFCNLDLTARPRAFRLRWFTKKYTKCTAFVFIPLKYQNTVQLGKLSKII